jgi:hypothetical protein
METTEKEKLKISTDYIYDFGASLDDKLESYEKELEKCQLVINIQEGTEKKYNDLKQGLINDLINGLIKPEEYKLARNVDDALCLKLSSGLDELRKKRDDIKSKVDVYKAIISDLKKDYDEKSSKIKSITDYENIQKLATDNKISMTQAMIRRPTGVHPGNPLGARKLNNLAIHNSTQEAPDLVNIANEINDMLMSDETKKEHVNVLETIINTSNEDLIGKEDNKEEISKAEEEVSVEKKKPGRRKKIKE